MDQYENDEMASNYTKYRKNNKVVTCVYKPSILKLVGNLSDKSIIDHGCGTGFYTQLFAESARQVVGVDCAKQMIEKAKKIDFELGARQNVVYHVDDCSENLNLGKHDVVFSSFMLCHAINIEHLENILRSMYNSGKPGSVCCGITTNPFLNSNEFSFIRKYGFNVKISATPKVGEERILEIYEENDTDKLMLFLCDHYYPPTVIEETFDKVGFVNFKWVRVSVGEDYELETEYLADYIAHPNGIMYHCQKP